MVSIVAGLSLWKAVLHSVFPFLWVLGAWREISADIFESRQERKGEYTRPVNPYLVENMEQPNSRGYNLGYVASAPGYVDVIQFVPKPEL